VSIADLARRQVVGAALLLLAGLYAAGAIAETSEVRVVKQIGLGFLPLMIMEHEKLIEKQAKAAGLGDVKGIYATIAGPSLLNDAMLAGRIDVGANGPTSIILAWARTKGTDNEIKGMAAMITSPMYLNSNNPKIRTVADIAANDRIAVPGVKVSPQAITLQRAAAQAWGKENYGKLDPLTVNMSHPMGMQAMLSGAGEITSQFTSPPFQYEELKHPGVRTLLSTYDVWGGPQTFICAWTTTKFKEANPKTYSAFVAALKEAIDWINHDKPAAAELYVRLTRGKDTAADIQKILDDPLVEYTLTPKNIVKFIEFKNEIGTMKVKPASWKDLFFDNVHDLAGS